MPPISETTSTGTAYKVYGPNAKGGHTLSIHVNDTWSKQTHLRKADALHHLADGSVQHGPWQCRGL